ncbi:unnamed protein product [Cuscuta epithymum]|uniref:X8 domain-containing protein n=1 Tax=Cuscuta epithymum TaxID=186058 RepID=A0AAV0C4H1_9ASTE|nr:unnamed protein product [Cuscuta epithymum]CAH9136697.1 unnamed protein product [Cuscuta epithymum]
MHLDRRWRPGMAEPPSAAALILCGVLMVMSGSSADATWCVARSVASDEALQVALDYACGSGADCTPLQREGLCFLPNTLLAHASYAFNSYYQRTAMAPGSCDFAGTATVAKTDPSYGSCVYPSSVRTAGGPVTPRDQGTTSGIISSPPDITTILFPPPPPGAAISVPGDEVGGNVIASPNSSGSQAILAVLITNISFLFLLAHIL